MPFKFENLRVWKDSIELIGVVHEVSLKFPKEELYILTPQIKRAADSVSLNIAEGSTGQSNPEFKRFLGMAIRSAIEVISCIYIGKKRGIISYPDLKVIYETTDSLVKKIQALRNKL